MTQFLKNILSLLVLVLAFVFLFTLIQTKHIWGDIYIEQILINLEDGISVASDKLLLGYAISAVLGIITAISLSLILKNNFHLLITSCLCFLFVFYQIGIFSYFFHKNVHSKIYEKEYAYPQNIDFTFLNSKRNLIVIYLESIEENYATSPYLRSNLIPNIFGLMKTSLSFEGFYQLKRQDYTAAAMVQSMCAVPYKKSVLKGHISHENFLANLVCYPQILEQNDYQTVFIKGADIKFAKADLFMRTHGFKKVMGKDQLKKEYPSFPLTNNRGAFSGYRDGTLYEMIKLELLNLSKSEKPFALSFITLDTHTPDYFLSPECNPASSHKEAVVHCADTMLSNFLNWLKVQDFYQNTTVVVLADHTETGNNSLYPKEKNRKIINFILNPSPIFTKKPHTAFTTLDIAPTILNALGIHFKDGKFGLGRSLFQVEPTLLEKMGLKLETELLKSSEVYESFETTKVKSEPQYHLYAPLGIKLSTPDEINHYTTYANTVLDTVFSDELSFTLPKTENQSLSIEFTYKAMLVSQNKRTFKIMINNHLLEEITITSKDKQPLSKTIKFSTSLLNKDKLLLQFKDEDETISDSLGIGLLSLSIKP